MHDNTKMPHDWSATVLGNSKPEAVSQSGRSAHNGQKGNLENAILHTLVEFFRMEAIKVANNQFLCCHAIKGSI